MKLFFTCVLLLASKATTATTNSIRISADSTPNPVPVEKYVKSLEHFQDISLMSCVLYVFSLSPVTIISSNNPVVLLSTSFKRVNMKSHCNIINVFTPKDAIEIEEHLQKVKKFIFRNFAIIQQVVIFLQENQTPSDFQAISKKFRKNVIVIEHGDKHPTAFNYGLKYCRGDPKCILYRRVIKVGYNEIKPYIQVQGWQKGFPELMPVMNMTPENLSSIRKLFSGVEAEMLELIVEIYKVTFILIPCEFGQEQPNGTWTGKLGLLSEQKLNMVIGSLPGNYRRGKVGKHSAQIFTIHFTLTSRKPEQLSSYQALLRPFPWIAWFILFACITVIGPVTWWITTTHAGLTRQSLEGRNNLTIWGTCGNAALTLLVEPWKDPPRGPATFILCGWFLAALALQCLYSSNLIASLSIPMMAPPVNTFQDAKEQQKTVLVKTGTTPALLLKNKKVHNVANFRLVESVDEYGAIALENKSNVATYDVNIFRFKMLAAGMPLKNYHMSPKPFLIIFSGWLYSQEFKLVEAIDMAILRAAGAGLAGKWFQDQFLNGSGRNRIITTEREARAELALEFKDRPLSMFQLNILFYFWVIGMCASVGVFVAELSLNKMCNRGTRVKKLKQEYPWVYLE